MDKKRYQGSCACGRVKFEADLDISQGTHKCNCTHCWKRRWWSVKAGIDLPPAFVAGQWESERPGWRRPTTGIRRHLHLWDPANVRGYPSAESHRVRAAHRGVDLAER